MSSRDQLLPCKCPLVRASAAGSQSRVNAGAAFEDLLHQPLCPPIMSGTQDVKALLNWFDTVASSKQAMVDTASAQALVHSQEI